MLLCCLRRKIEASCHKHFVVVSREQQTTPVTSDKCHQLATVRRSCMYNMWRSNRWRHATKPDNGRERYSIGMVHPSIVCLSVTCVNVTQRLNFSPMFCTIYSSKIWTVRIKILGKNSEFHEIVQVKYNGVWTRSSAVAKRPRDAPCLYSFYTLE